MPPSDRSFGFVFTIFFALVGCLPVLHRHPMRLWAIFVSTGFLSLAVTAPRILHPLNIVWTALGRALGKITTPVITGLIFFVVFAPAAVFMRLLGKDLLRVKFNPAAATYWIPSHPPESMTRQF